MAASSIAFLNIIVFGMAKPFMCLLMSEALEAIVKGRKTSLFFQNLMGAWRASMRYGFFETCSMNHLNPQQWLTYVLNNIEITPADQLPNLLPQNFDKRLLKLV